MRDFQKIGGARLLRPPPYTNYTNNCEDMLWGNYQWWIQGGARGAAPIFWKSCIEHTC